MRYPGLMLFCWLAASVAAAAAAMDSPRVTSLVVTNGQARLEFAPAPATDEYQVLRSTGLDGPYQPAGAGLNGWEWTGPLDGADGGFFRVAARQLGPNDLLTATLLNRLAYGPTPDELERVRRLGPDAYIAEQLAPEKSTQNLDFQDVTPRWRQATATGTGSASKLYLYLDGAGEVYLDDIRLVAGNGDDGSKPNLLRNGGFEAALGTDWNLSPNLIGSARNAEYVHGGGASLHLIATEAGATQASSIYQLITPALNAAQTYTLSYWYLTSAQTARLTVRLSGEGIVSSHGLSGDANSPGPLYGKLEAGQANRADLRAWQVLHAVQSERQLTEVLRQFLENHFVTQVGKSLDYFDNRGYDSVTAEQLAVRTEFAENRRWREALLNPQVTFRDLLQISAESPAMIVYLDTVSSRGDGGNVANENYARELCELFCFGVDNGYDQQDIVQISRAWTGWRLELKNPADEFNPFGARSTNYLDATAPADAKSGLPRNANTNVIGNWGFKYQPNRHNNNAKYLFHHWDANGVRGAAKTVPARFGAPWAGRDYSLTLPARTGTNSIQDGYATLKHMADQPFTQEFVSVKLCRLFVHDGFQTGYDFTDAGSSPEEELVHQCMLAWESSAPKGQLRDVLRVIFGSELFRSHGGSLHKVKTPLEFAVSTVRALRAKRADGRFTAETDGYDVYNFMNRAGRMRLFDRAEPDGYPEDAPGWISAGTLADRLRFVQAALMPTGTAGKEDAGVNLRVDVMALLQLKLPNAADRRDAGLVADFFLRNFFPAEGAANLAAYRGLALNFLNTAEDGTTASPLDGLVPDSIAYEQRVRGLVGVLLSTQRFQEQ